MGVSVLIHAKIVSLTEHQRFEISLNKSDDLRFAASHFKSIKVPQTTARYNLNEVGSKIMSEITQRIGSSLPQREPMQKRKHRIHKPPKHSCSKPSRSKSAKIGRQARS